MGEEERPVLQMARPLFDPLALLPPGTVLTSLQQYGDGAHIVEQSAMLFSIIKVEEAVTTEKHRVKHDRTRLTLQEKDGGMLTRCWVYGMHSRAVGKLGVKLGDLLLVSAVKKAIFAPKPGEEVLTNFSPWILHCGDHFGMKSSVTFIRKEGQENLTPVNVEQQHEVTTVAATTIAAPPVKKSVDLGAPRSQYCKLADLKDTSARYNLFAVVSEVVEQPRGRKSKIVARVRLQDESMVVCGDLANSFRFDILASSMEQIPELEVGAVLRIHNMRVEKWNGVFDGRVYSGSSVTSVLGGVGEAVKPMCHKKGPEMKWVEADNRKIEELRRWWADRQNPRKVLGASISSLAAETPSSLSCRVSRIHSAPSGLVLRLEDGSKCSLRTVEFCGLDTQTDEVGEESSFIDLWLDADQGRQAKGEGVRQGSLVQVDNLIPVNVGEEDDVVVRFVSGGLVKRLLGEEAKELATTIDERISESQLNMTSVQAVIDMVDKEGTFEYESQQVSSTPEVANSVPENYVSRNLAPPQSVLQFGDGNLLREEDGTVDVSLSPWDPSQTNQRKVSQQVLTDEMVSLSSSWNSAEKSSTNRTSAALDPSPAGVAYKHVVDALSSGEEFVDGALSSLPAEEKEVGEEDSSPESALLLDSQESQVTPFMVLGTVVREKLSEKRPKASVTEVEDNDQELNDPAEEKAAHHSSKQVKLSQIRIDEEVERLQAQPCQQFDTQEIGEHSTFTTPLEESQFFTCPNADTIPVSLRVADGSSKSEDEMCNEATAGPRQKRVRRSTECSDANLNFATAPQPPESQLTGTAATDLLSNVEEENRCRAVGDQTSESTERAELLAIACYPSARMKRVTTGLLCTAPTGSYRLLGVVVKASLETEECPEPKVRLDVRDDEGQVSLIVTEREVEKMCRDFLVQHSLSVEQGLLELEGKVADLGVEKTAEGHLVIHSKMI